MKTATRCRNRLPALLLAALALLPAAAQVAAPLPPAPDSLRPALAAARTPAARQSAYLRTAAALAEAEDAPGTTAYAAAAAALAAQRHDAAGRGRAASLHGYALLQQGEAAQAAPLLHQATPLLAAAPLPWQADHHAYLAWLLGDTDHLAEAQRYLRLARAEYGRLGNRAAQADLSGTASAVYLYQGRGDSAALVLLQAARQQQALGLARAEAVTLGNVATVLQQLGRLPEAERYARQALALFRAQGNTAQLPLVYQDLGNIAWARHRPAEAVPHYRTCLRGLAAQGLAGQGLSCLGSLAGALSDLGRLDSAIYYQTQAVQLCRRQGQTTQLAIELSALAQVYGKARRWPEAEQYALASLAAQGSKKLQNERALAVLVQVATARADFRQALGYEHRLRLSAAARSARESQRLVQQERSRFETDRAEQQVALLSARTQLQTEALELSRLRTRQERAGLGALVALALLLGGAAFGQYRRRQVAARAAAAAALRQRLAADLHDDVGNLLTQLNLQSGLLSEPHRYTPAQVAQRLDALATTARRAAQQMSDVVWGLGETHRTLPELLLRMRDHAQEVLAPAGIDAEFFTDLPPTAPLPSAETRQQLYLIFKEALHNVVKHAGASLVTVRLAATPAGLRLTVADNGRGHSGAARPGGHGLANMQARAAAAGGRVQYRPGQPGFVVEATLGAA